MPQLFRLQEGSCLAWLPQECLRCPCPSLPEPRGQPQPQPAWASVSLVVARTRKMLHPWHCLHPGSSLKSNHPTGCRGKTAHLHSLIIVIMKWNAKNCTCKPLMHSQPDNCLQGSWPSSYLQQQDLLLLGFDLHSQKYPQNQLIKHFIYIAMYVLIKCYQSFLNLLSGRSLLN